jgi:hypothetical protein
MGVENFVSLLLGIGIDRKDWSMAGWP